MTMQDMTFIKQIAEGGSFDPVQAIRALARAAATNAPVKEAPAAVMDAGACALEPTTIIDLTPIDKGDDPVVIRQGQGKLAPLGLA